MLAHTQFTIHQEPPRSFICKAAAWPPDLTCAGPWGGGIFLLSQISGLPAAEFREQQEAVAAHRASQETVLPLTSLTCGVGTLLTGPSSNIGGGGGGGGGEGKTSSGAGGKGSSKGGGGGGKAQFEEKLASSPGGGGGGSGSSMGKNENKSKFG